MGRGTTYCLSEAKEQRRKLDWGEPSTCSRSCPCPLTLRVHPRSPGLRHGPAAAWSEGHAGAAVAQQAGQDATVQLVELHELQQVGEARLALIHAEVEAALLLALGQSQGVGGQGGA